MIDSNEKLFGEATARHVDYGYDQAGFLTSMSYDGHTVGITPDPFGRIGAVSADSFAVASYEYVGQRVAQRVYPTTTSVTYQPTYDNLGRITSANSGLSIARFDYEYDANTNNISSKQYSHRSGTPSEDYAYDNLSRVTRSDYINSEYETFTMDDLGNRSGTQYVRDGSTVSYTVNTLTNTYTQVGSAYPTYDNAGNMTKDENAYNYHYDYENRIIEIKKTNDTITVATFAYDALGRRIPKVDSVAGMTTRYYYNNNWQVLCEKNASGTTQRRYVYGNYIDEPI